MKTVNFTLNILKEIDNATEYKIQTLIVNYSSEINSIKYLTGLLIGVIAIFILFIVSFDISKLYKYIVKKFQKPKSVKPSQNVACNNFFKTIVIDRRCQELVKKKDFFTIMTIMFKIGKYAQFSPNFTFFLFHFHDIFENIFIFSIF
jgi:hypothetical protein